ncbi:MAG TPA: phosphatase PAP2 family protein [Candidatus Aquilonibacter sp.]
MNEDVRLTIAAACCFGATFALGGYVAHRPLARFDVGSIALRGRGTRLAMMFTRSGYWPALVAVGTVLFAAELIVRRGVAFAVVFGGMQLLSQAASHLTKEFFKRTRPDDWLHRKELGFSYPSGHATTAIVFYGGLLLFAWNAPLPRELQLAASAGLVVWMAGIAWSRIALAAHYGTDVCGGILFGAAWLCVMIVLLRHLPAAHISV